jgi:hypothetical protein
MEDLLKRLKKHECFKKLPCRLPTLMRSALTKNMPVVQTIAQGEPDQVEYVYFGMLNSVCRQLSQNKQLKTLVVSEKKVQIIVNTDGARLFKSSYFNKTAWPLLGRIFSPDHRIPPFVIALHIGNSKPDHKFYLSDFAHEASKLNGKCFDVDGVSITFELLLITADAPARAFIKQICGHNGRCGCEKCLQRQWKEGGIRCNFKYENVDTLQLRTDATFRSMEDAGHHKARTALLKISSFDIINQIVLDPMHLCDEGVTKKVLFHAAIEKKGKFRISDTLMRQMNTEINAMAPYLPSDFQRRLVPTKYLSSWKATSFRLFGEYAGPVLLKGKLSDAQYCHFLNFHCAMRILRNRESVKDDELLDTAQNFLEDYVKNYNKFFGANQIVYCVHSLLHLVRDVRKFHLPLDDLSCYDFENFLKELLNSVNSGSKITTQIRNRLFYQRELQMRNLITADPIISSEKRGSRLRIDYQRYFLKFPTKNDSYVLTNDLVVLQVQSLAQQSRHANGVLLNCVIFEHCGPLFNLPVDSSEFCTTRVKATNRRVQCSLDTIIAKMFVMPYRDHFVAMPLLHTII